MSGIYRNRNSASNAFATKAILEILSASTNPNVKASFCKLLAISGSFTLERDSCSREDLKRQSSPKIPDIGYDILTQATRAVSLRLLKSLGEATASDGSGAADVTND